MKSRDPALDVRRNVEGFEMAEELAAEIARLGENGAVVLPSEAEVEILSVGDFAIGGGTYANAAALEEPITLEDIQAAADEMGAAGEAYREAYREACEAIDREIELATRTAPVMGLRFEARRWGG